MIRFCWDDRKNLVNRRKHGVSFETAIRVFHDPFVLFEQDREVDGEVRWQALGRASERVLLLVAHAYEYNEENSDERIRIISARGATQREAEVWAAQFHARG